MSPGPFDSPTQATSRTTATSGSMPNALVAAPREARGVDAGDDTPGRVHVGRQEKPRPLARDMKVDVSQGVFARSSGALQGALQRGADSCLAPRRAVRLAQSREQRIEMRGSGAH